MEDLYIEDYKILIGQIKDDLNKWWWPMIMNWKIQ